MSHLSALLAQIRTRRETTVTQAVQLIQLSAFETETENRLASLRMAARHLSDEAVSAAWIETIPGEKDPIVHRAKLEGIATLLAGLQVRPAHYSQIATLIPSLTVAICDAELRPSALAVLAHLVIHTPEAGAALATAYRQIKDRELRVAIVEALAPLRFRWEGIVPFLKEALPDLTAELKPAIVSFLLDREALDETAQLALLSPGESPAVRFAVVVHWNDRSTAASPALMAKFLQLVRTEPDRAVRAEAMLFLELQADARSFAVDDVFIDILRRDTEPALRHAAARGLARLGGDTPARLEKLSAALQAETREEIFTVLLAMLMPHASGNNAAGEKIRALLLTLLKGNLQTALANRIVDALEKNILRDPALGESLLTQFEDSRDDRHAAHLLEALARQAPDDERFTPIYTRACTSPSAAVRSAGLRGLVSLPLTPPIEPVLLARLELINDAGIADEVRQRLGKKIARIPAFSAEDIVRLKTVIAGLSAGTDLRKGLEAAATRSAEASGTEDAPDWEMWRNRLLKEKRTDGMLPELYLCYDRFPAESAALLKAIVKTPGHRADRFDGDFHRNDTILSFLRTKNAIDDEMSRYAAAFLLEKDNSWGDLDFYLSLLKANLAFPALKETLWSALERERTATNINLVLLRETLWFAYGGDEAMASAFIERARGKTNARDFLPYLRFLEKNSRWSPMMAVLAALQPTFPADLFATTETQKTLKEIYNDQGQPMPVPTPPAAPTQSVPKPGELLDE